MRCALGFFFLAVILADLGDASCDPLVRDGRNDPDPCSIVCVADCFCCASKIATHREGVLEEPGSTEPAPAPSLGQPAAGVRPAPYHPPNTL